MKQLKLIAAVLAVCTLSACVGFIVPLPVSGSTTTTTTGTQDKDSSQQH